VDTLSTVFNTMIQRASDRILGVESVDAGRQAGSGDSALVSRRALLRHHASLFHLLHGIHPADFDSVIQQFVDVCAEHVMAHEAAEMRAEEERERERERELIEAMRRAQEERAAARRMQEEEERRVMQEELERERERQLDEERKRAQEEKESRLMREAAEAAEADRRQREEKERREREVAERIQRERLEAERRAAADADDEHVVAAPRVPVPVAAPLQPAALSASQQFNSLLQQLREMGYGDDELNTYVLQKTKLDVAQAIDWIQTDEATGGELRREMERARNNARRA